MDEFAAELAAFEAAVDALDKRPAEALKEDAQSEKKRKRSDSGDVEEQVKPYVVVGSTAAAAAPTLSKEFEEALDRAAGITGRYKKHAIIQSSEDDRGSVPIGGAQQEIGPALPDFLVNAAAQANPSEADKQKKNLRTKAGKIWEDKTLSDWPENDFRLWVGMLGPEVTDSTLSRAFEAYPSFNMARAVKDKKTGECRGYGFVSFSDPLEMARAMRENQGKYCGHRRMKIKRGSEESRDLRHVRKEERNLEKFAKKFQR